MKKILSVLSALLLVTTLSLPASSAAALSDQEVDRNKTFRKSIGFSTDPHLIHKLASDSKTNDSKQIYGVDLTEDEINELRFREKLAKEAVDLRNNFIIKKYNHLFGGAYIDHKDGGVLKINLVKLLNNRQAREDIQSKFPHQSRIKFVDAQLTEIELKQVQTEIDALMNEYTDLQIQYTDLSIPNNKVIVGIKNYTQENVEYLNQMFGSHKILIKPSNLTNGEESRSAKTRPLEGGLKIDRYPFGSSSWCSGAFSAYSSSGSYYYITAAHCGALNTTWYQGGTSQDYNDPKLTESFKIGTVTRHNYGGNSDAAAILISSTLKSNYLYGSENSVRNKFVAKQGYTQDIVGEIVCQSGVTSGVQCGQLLSRSYSESVNGVVFSNLRKADYASNGGDSGAPIFSTQSGSRTDKVLKGVHRGYTTDFWGNRDGAMYSHVQYVLNDLGLYNAVLQ